VSEASVPSTAATGSFAARVSADLTTTCSRGTELAQFIAGFIAGEGTFTYNGRNYTFAVALGATDAGSCELLYAFFGVGHLYHYPRRKPHYDDVAVYQVRKTRDLVNVIVPFMDEHLPISYKRAQYVDWREKVLDYWDHHMKRRRTCTIEGCDKPQKGHGVCRHHMYELYGK